MEPPLEKELKEALRYDTEVYREALGIEMKEAASEE